MKTFGLTLVVLGLALAAAIPASDAQGQTSYTLVTHTEGSGGYFTLEGQTEHNPTLEVPDGQSITLTVKAGDGDGVHNLCVGTTCTSDYVSNAGDTQTVTFTSSSSTTEYHCQPHQSAGMKGTIKIAGSTTTATSSGDNKSPGVQVVGVTIAMIGAALLVARRSK